ncbi:MAG: retropepsin-like aspartic protease [Nitrospirae bacterium]|nr:retropepsin-like aspartic protease [Nitrospirota bacterium]
MLAKSASRFLIRTVIFVSVLWTIDVVAFQYLESNTVIQSQFEQLGKQLNLSHIRDVLFNNSSLPSESGIQNLDSSDDLIIIPATRAGDHLLVTVELNDFQEVTLLVDTGASFISLSSDLAFDLGILESESQQILTNTANGTAQAFITKLEVVRVGEATQQNVQASFSNKISTPYYDGLLGMSFLKHYIVDVNLAHEELRLHPR